MTRTTKTLAVLVGIGLVVVLGTGMLVAATAVSSGLMTVSVHEEGPDGVDLFIPVPAGLVEVALGVAPVVIRLADRHDGFDFRAWDFRAGDFGSELGEVLPLLRIALEEIAGMPDAVLVEVGGVGESVRVSKRGRSLLVLVEQDGSRVAVTIPLRVLRAVSGLLD